MYAVKRQFRIWKHELLEGWDKIDFYGRILLGAGVAAGLSMLCVKQILRPLNAELTELRANLQVPENLDPEKDEEIIMNRDKADKLKVSLKSWKERLGEFEAAAVYLQPDIHLEVISALQNLLDRCGLLLISEQLVLPEPETPTQKRGHSKTAEKPKPAGPLATYTHRYEIHGTFRQIQAFLLLTEKLEWRLTLRDIGLEPVEEANGLLALRFNLDIHYLKEKL